MSDFLAVSASFWGILMALAPVLQIRRMRHTGSSADVSIGWLGVLIPGFVLWALYGVSIGNLPIMLTNTVSLTFGVATVVIALRYRHLARSRPA